jgi:hypothetical protein
LAGTPIAAGQAQIQPVGRLIDGALEVLRVYEGFQKQQPMAKALLPIGTKPLVAQRKNLGAEIGTMPVGQNEKPAVVGDQFEPVIIVLVVKIPADPPIAHRAFPCRGRKAQQRHPLILVAGHVPKRLTDLGQIAQVVMRRHQLAMKPLLVVLNGTHS